MKLEKLQKALDSAAGFTTNREGLQPETSMLWLDKNTITATNGRCMARIRFDEDFGVSCQVPADKLLRLAKTVQGDEITFSVDNDKLTVSCGHTTATYYVKEEPGVFAQLPFDVVEWRDIPTGMMDALSICRFAVSTDSSRGAACGLHIHDGAVTASDALRIAYRKFDGDCEDTVTLRTELIDELVKHPEDIKRWAIQGDVSYFQLSDDTIMAAAVHGTAYPYEQTQEAIKKAEEMEVATKLPGKLTEAVTRHVGQMDAVAAQDRRVRLSVNGKEVKLSSTDGASYSLEDTMESDKDQPNNIAFSIHPQFLRDILGLTSNIRFDAESGFVAFHDDKGFSYLAVVEKEPNHND